MRLILPLVTAALLIALPSTAHAAAATVVRVIDGDTVRLEQGGRARNVDLIGVDAPEKRDCHGAEATKALKRLLPRGARVQVQGDRKAAGRARYLKRSGTLVNAALVRSGAARAAADPGLRLGAKLTAAQDAARRAGRGLWAACPAPQPQPQSQPSPPQSQPQPQTPDVLTGDAAIQRARTDLQGKVFIRITTTTFSSSESWLHLCSDGSYVEEVSTSSDLGGGTSGRYHGRWEVIAAEYRTGVAGAQVRRLNNDGTEGFVTVVAQGNGVTVNGNVVTVQASNACT